MIRVSVVVVSWNTRALLDACLTSAEHACARLGQPCEIIVVDNASHDGSAAMVAASHRAAAVVQNTSNRGFAAATNQGIALATGEFVLLLNPDTELAIDALARLVDFLEAHTRVAAVGPRVIGRDGEVQASCSPLPGLGRELWRLLHLDGVCPWACYPVKAWDHSHARAVEVLQGACMLVRREVFERVGPLDEQFFIYSEEVDLCRRMADAGWTLFWVPAATIVHYGGESTRQAAPRMFLELYRSKIRYFRKHLGRPGAVAYKLVLLLTALPRVVVPPVLARMDPSRRVELSTVARNYRALLLALPTF